MEDNNNVEVRIKHKQQKQHDDVDSLNLFFLTKKYFSHIFTSVHFRDKIEKATRQSHGTGRQKLHKTHKHAQKINRLVLIESLMVMLLL